MATKCNNSGIYASVRGKRRKAAEMLVNPEFDGNITRLCSQLSVARSTLYRWFDESDFNGYINWLIERYTDSELANVWRSLIKKATQGGDVQAQKLYFELKEKYKQKLEIEGNAVIFLGENEIEE